MRWWVDELMSWWVDELMSWWADQLMSWWASWWVDNQFQGLPHVLIFLPWIMLVFYGTSWCVRKYQTPCCMLNRKLVSACQLGCITSFLFEQFWLFPTSNKGLSVLCIIWSDRLLMSRGTCLIQTMPIEPLSDQEYGEYRRFLAWTMVEIQNCMYLQCRNYDWK